MAVLISTHAHRIDGDSAAAGLPPYGVHERNGLLEAAPQMQNTKWLALRLCCAFELLCIRRSTFYLSQFFATQHYHQHHGTSSVGILCVSSTVAIFARSSSDRPFKCARTPSGFTVNTSICVPFTLILRRSVLPSLSWCFSREHLVRLQRSRNLGEFFLR